MVIHNGKKPSIDELTRLAKEAGFTYAAPLAMDSLVFRPEVREMCESGRCRSYGKSWSCPPAVGSLEVIAKRAAGFENGIIVQTSGSIDELAELMKDHKRHFDTLVRQIKSFCPDCLPMGAGACTRCRVCTYPDRPCRHPDRMYPSMEAYGLLVNDVATKSGLRYNYDGNTMTYTSCVLIERKGETYDR